MGAAQPVRPIGPADHEGVLAVARALPEWFNAGGLESIARDLPRQEGWVALDDGRVVGWILGAPTGARTAELTWLGVERGHQRRGVGTALVGALERQLRAAGAAELFVSTVADSVDYEPYEGTRAFYRARGFANFRVDRGFFKDPRGDYDRLLMRKRL